MYSLWTVDKSWQIEGKKKNIALPCAGRKHSANTFVCDIGLTTVVGSNGHRTWLSHESLCQAFLICRVCFLLIYKCRLGNAQQTYLYAECFSGILGKGLVCRVQSAKVELSGSAQRTAIYESQQDWSRVR